jgi:dihydrodipicolinate synthase/N-acetylneuraminate lyase
MKPEKKYSGVVIPAVTPFTEDYQLDQESVEKIFSNFRNNKVAPFILGTTGEAASIPFSVKRELLELTGKLKKNDDVLYAGISSNVFLESLALAKHAFDNGTDVVVATLPSYYALTETEMLRYFEELAEAISGPLIIYNIPATTHMSIPLAVIDRLSHHPNIVGTKDSERSEDRLKESVQLWSGRTDFSHFLGWAARSAEAILTGSDGLVPSSGNIYPSLYAELNKAAKEGNSEKSLQLQQASDAWGNLYQQGRTLGQSLYALKFVMKQLHLCEPYVMPPLQALTAKDEEDLLAAYNELKNKEELKITI